MNGLDWGVVAAYVGLIVLVGWRAARGERSADAHLRASRDLPAWAVVFSVLATEVSAATYIGVPESAFRSNWNYLQFAIGALLGKVIVGTVLVKLYWRLNLATAYGFLAQRAGPRTQRAAASAFVVGRLIGSGVRTFIAAVAFSVVADVDLYAAIAGICIVATLYTMFGGLKAVVWTDVAQGSIFFIGASAAVIFALWKLSEMGTGPAQVLEEAVNAGKLQFLNLQFLEGGGWSEVFSSHKPLITAIVGGAFLTLATHGTCQENVQHLLNVRTEKGAVRSLITSGLFTFPIVAMFLSVGTVLFVYHQHLPPVGYGVSADDDVRRIFPNFTMHVMPAGLRGLVFAGLFAAAVASLGATINAVVATWTKDIQQGSTLSLRAVRGLMALCGVALMAIALFFVWWASQSSDDLVNIALSSMTIIYGGILGTFLSALLLPRRSDGALVLALCIGIAAGVSLFFHPQLLAQFTAHDPKTPVLAWPWYIPLSATCTLLYAWLQPQAPTQPKSA
jgi:SSS family transporter